MGFWDSIAEGSFKGLLGGVGTLAKDIRTAITGKEPLSSEQQLELLRQLNALETLAAQVEQQAAAGQIDINKIDAQSGSMFKGGWRPAIGWICACGLSYTFVIRPVLPWCVEVAALILDKIVVLPAMPPLDTAELLALTFSLLGFGGIRMYERIKGKA